MSLVLIAAETGISKQDFDNMLDFEQSLFEDMMKCMDASDKRIDKTLGGGEEEKQKNELVSFIEDVEEFVGVEGEKMGPFEKGQIANIPKEIVKILIIDNKVEVIGQ